LSDAASRSRRGELLAASLLTGLLGAATVYASELHLGLDAFTPLAQLWTFWALFAASVTFGVQQWVIRSIIARSDQREVFRRLLWRLATASVVVAAGSALMADHWFDRDERFSVLCGLLVIGTGVNGYGRGFTAATGSIRRLALLIVGENVIRFALLLPLVVLDADIAWYGVGLLAGFAINVVALPPKDVTTGAAVGTSFAPDGAATGGADLLTAGAVGLISYATIFGGPLLLGPADVPSSAVSALFLVVTLARIPFIVVLGLLPRVALQLEVMTVEGRLDELGRFVRRVATAVVAGAAVVGTAAAVAAQTTVARLLGTRDEFGGSVYALVGSASILALGSLVFSMALLAVRRRRWLAATWAIPVVVAGVALGAGWLTSVERLAWTLLGVEAVLVAALAIGVTRGAAGVRVGSRR
jgi:hypothetical protein